MYQTNMSIGKENVTQIKFALYRDDGIGVHSRIPTSQMEKIKKTNLQNF